MASDVLFYTQHFTFLLTIFITTQPSKLGVTGMMEKTFFSFQFTIIAFLGFNIKIETAALEHWIETQNFFCIPVTFVFA